MATPGELIKAVAQVLNVPEVTISTYYRNLREAGLVTKGGRGRSAPRMSAGDASPLLIACGGAGIERENAAKTVAEYSSLRVSHTARMLSLPDPEGLPGHLHGDWIENDAGTWIFDGLSIPSLQALPERHTFGAALTALIEAAMNGEFDRARMEGYPDRELAQFIEVSFYGPEPLAGIEIDLHGVGDFSYKEEGNYQLPQQIEKNPNNYSEIEEDIRQTYGSGDLEIRRKFGWRTIYELARLLKT